MAADAVAAAVAAAAAVAPQSGGLHVDAVIDAHVARSDPTVAPIVGRLCNFPLPTGVIVPFPAEAQMRMRGVVRLREQFMAYYRDVAAFVGHRDPGRSHHNNTADFLALTGLYKAAYEVLDFEELASQCVKYQRGNGGFTFPEPRYPPNPNGHIPGNQTPEVRYRYFDLVSQASFEHVA